MNKYLKNNISLILKIFLYLQPVIDLLTGIMINYFNISITIGIIVRLLFLIFILYYYLIVKRKDKDINKICYSFTVLIFLIISSCLIIINKDISVLGFELSNILKIFYFPLLITLIDKDDLKITINDIVNVGIIYLSLIAIPNLFNISYNSYTQGKIGSVGLFNSGNEISAILSIITPFIIYYIFNKNNNYKKLLLIILMMYTYFTIGSKIIIVSLVLSLLFNIFLYLKNNKVEKNKILISLLIIIILLIGGVYLLPKTNFYYNIKLHLDFLGINSFKDIFSFKFIDRFIFSDRLTYLSYTNNIYLNSSLFEKLFGIGFINNYATDLVSIKVIEMDFFDVFYRVGILGFIIFIIPLINIIQKIFKEKNSLIIFTLILSLLISFLVGHTLTAPSVSIILCFVLKYKRGKI